MIKGKGEIRKVAGQLFCDELDDALDKLHDGEDYKFLIVDNKRNRALPYLNYLFSVVLKALSDQLPDKPSTKALYRYFEELFAPEHTCTIGGEHYTYQDMKGEKSNDFDVFIERIIDYSTKKWGAVFPEKNELTDPANREYYIQAYAEQEAEWISFISSKKNKKLSDERRN